MKFRFDGFPDTFDAVAFGPTWNGWAQPIVTAETLRRFVAHWSLEDDEMTHVVALAGSGEATISHRYRDYHQAEIDPDETYNDTLVPDPEGNYTLTLGLTLVEVS